MTTTSGSLSKALDPFREFAALRLKRTDLKAQLDEVNGQLSAMEESIRNTMIDAGIGSQQVTVGDDNVNVHLWSQTRGRRKDEFTRDEIARTLKDVGLEDLTSFGYEWNKLDAWVREQVKEDPGLSTIPEPLRDMLDIYTHTEARTRKA